VPLVSVWQQLEEQNPEFFKAYYLRLRLKNQITDFNKLLEDQLQIMNTDFSSGVPSMSPPDPPNGSSSNPCKTFVSSFGASYCEFAYAY
jgi:hypothetical protein